MQWRSMVSKRFLSHALVALVALALGIASGWTPWGSSVRTQVQEGASRAKSASLEIIVNNVDYVGTRELILLEYPELIEPFKEGASFGGVFSRKIAQDIFGRSKGAMKDASKLSRIEEVAPRTWMLYLPIVNAVLFETDEGLVLVDTGMAAAGPAVRDLIKSVSDAPIHTIIYTHGHVDHAFGAWALTDDNPQIIAHQDLPKRFDRYVRLRGSLANYMSQPKASLPGGLGDLVHPTRLIASETRLEIGGEAFILRPHKGETDDQLYVWVPGRSAMASADYYQGFIPNAGNGNRIQRFPEEWVIALREMASERPALLLPGHGKALSDPVLIDESLNTLANFLELIVEQTIEGLNKGMRKDQIAQSLKVSDRFTNDPILNEQYVSPQDISKMVIRKYTGWWDDVPSGWSPASLEDQATEIVALAGGVEKVVERANAQKIGNLALASHLIDWAWYADPSNTSVQAARIEIYRLRILDEGSNTMEMLTYLNAMIEVRDRQLIDKESKSTP